MPNPTLAEQRTALFNTLQLVMEPAKIAVIKYERDDPIPPCAMITRPRIIFPDNSKVGITEWSIRLYEVRKAGSAVADSFETLLPALLLPLGKGMNMGYVLSTVENSILDSMGYPLPGYIVVGHVPLANC